MSLVPMKINQSLVPTKDEFDIIHMMAKTASDSKYFEKLGGAPGILCVALYAREIGVPIMTAIMGGLQNVQGKITMSAELMNSLIRKAGHKVEILELSALSCKIKGVRKDTNEHYTASFTFEEAKKAGLVKPNGGYEKHPEDMLFARCISKLKRRLFPDVADRAYVEGELDDHIEDKPKEDHRLQVSDAEVVDASTGEVIQQSVIFIDKEQVQELMALTGDDEEYRKRLYKHFNIPSFDHLPALKFPSLRNKIVERNEVILKEEMAKT